MLLFVACLTIYIIIYFCIIIHFWQIYMMYGHSEVHTGGTVQNCAIKFTLYANIMSVLAPPRARDCHCHVCEELCCCWTKLNKLNSTSIMWLFELYSAIFQISHFMIIQLYAYHAFGYFCTFFRYHIFYRIIFNQSVSFNKAPKDSSVTGSLLCHLGPLLLARFNFNLSMGR